jgi:hypothetical protein
MKIKTCNIFYRGNALGRAIGITMLVLLLAGNASALYDSEAQSFLSLINNYRAQNNLGPLSMDALLQDSANWMSNDMLTSCIAGSYTCSHTDSTGRTFDQRLRDFGYPAGTTASAGENLAWGYNGGATTAQQVFNLWKNSPGHNANMLGSSYVAIGISRSCTGGNCAWVTDFGSKIVKPYNPTPTQSPTQTPTPIPTPSPSPTPTPSPTPISTPIPTPTPIPSAGSISGYSINDINGNGRWDTGEKGLQGWTIRLAGTGNEGMYIRKEVLTDATGFYKFQDVPAGRYTISEGLKASFVPTGTLIYMTSLTAGANLVNNNFMAKDIYN